MHVWGVHTQCVRRGCTCNVHMGDAHVMCMWGVHTQCTCGGCMHNACMGGVTPIN